MCVKEEERRQTVAVRMKGRKKNNDGMNKYWEDEKVRKR